MSRCRQTGQVTGTLRKNMVFSIWPNTTGHWKQNPQHIPPKLGVPLQKKTALSVWPKKLDIENKTLKHIPPHVRPQKKTQVLSVWPKKLGIQNKTFNTFHPESASHFRKKHRLVCLTQANWAFKTKLSTHPTLNRAPLDSCTHCQARKQVNTKPHPHRKSKHQIIRKKEETSRLFPSCAWLKFFTLQKAVSFCPLSKNYWKRMIKQM